MIAVTQARKVGPGHAYITKQLTRGKDKTAALRLLRRRLSDTVFTAQRADQQQDTQTTPPVSIAARPSSTLDIGASRRPGELLPVHRGGQGRQPQRRQGV
ncbi:hypothetical protein [Kribbella pittospori]|uniref:hypothetical protein n=1 Tax=Kribbella pittospori TaxID=722689 RepID=UPI00192E0F17|nr:hypothetical protein [Kribbella pittospori]